MANLLKFFVNHCFETEKAEKLLAEHGYKHHPWEHGHVGGGKVKTTGRYFELSEDGEFMILQPVYCGPIPSLYRPVEEPIIADVIAWHPAKPEKWFFFRGEIGLILNEEALFNAEFFGDPLLIHRHPFAWLKAQTSGTVLLDKLSYGKLYGLKEVIASDLKHGSHIESVLKSRFLKSIPEISIPVGEDQPLNFFQFIPQHSAIGAGVTV